MNNTSECKTCILSQVCELKKNKRTPCKCRRSGYTERKEK